MIKVISLNKLQLCRILLIRVLKIINLDFQREVVDAILLKAIIEIMVIKTLYLKILNNQYITIKK